MAKIYFGGVPTDLDVERIIREVNAQPGASVAYSVLAGIIGAPIKSNRFRTVMTAYRKRIWRDHKLRIKAGGGEFRFLTGGEALQEGRNDIHRVGRAAGRAHKNIIAIDETGLSQEQKSEHALLRRVTAANLEQHQKSAKELAPPSAVTAPPMRLVK